MINKEAQKRIEKLKQAINHHRYLRHVLDREEISEAALDSLKKELFDLEQKYPQFITEDSPTQRVEGKPLEKFEKTEHSKPMFSLNDAFSKQDVLDWQERFFKFLSERERNQVDYFCEVKVDGIAISLIYGRGVFKGGSTRGDGKIGENITNNLKTIEAIPLALLKPISSEVRGEAYISKKDFALLNKEQEKNGEEVFANPRNTAAGALRQLDPKITAKRRLSFLAWQLLGESDQKTEQEKLKELGFRTPQSRYCPSLKDVFVFYQAILQQRDKLPYQLDGIVVSVNNNALFDKLGVVGKSPRAAIAYKFPLKQATTIIEDIKLQVGRTGAITPVAVLKPVNIEGATITRATLHNEDAIKRLDIRIGDTAIVGRAGDVIPQVVKVLKELRPKNAKPFAMPSDCPICQTGLVKPTEQVVWKCPNKNCPAKNHKTICHFVSRGAFDIEGLGPKIIDQLADNGLIADAADLFFLQKGDLLPLESSLRRIASRRLLRGFAEKSADNLINEIAQKKQISLERFIYALGILNVGIETSLLLAKMFHLKSKILNLKSIEAEFLALSLDDLQKIQDIGPVVARSIYEWFHDKQHLTFLEKLGKAGIIIKSQISNFKSQKLLGKVFVLTGTLEAVPRDIAKEKIRQLGGNVSESVSRKTNYLVAGKDPGSKLAKAQALGVKILTENEFLKII